MTMKDQRLQVGQLLTNPRAVQYDPKDKSPGSDVIDLTGEWYQVFPSGNGKAWGTLRMIEPRYAAADRTLVGPSPLLVPRDRIVSLGVANVNYLKPDLK
jgi:hypothetical protein